MRRKINIMVDSEILVIDKIKCDKSNITLLYCLSLEMTQFED